MNYLTENNPKAIQDRWMELWDKKGYFHSQPNDHKPFTIVIPPPNVTGALHLGHAINNTIQDILIRWRKMQGFNALWIPGTDHAGIATQAVVEKRIFETEKKTRHEYGREALVEKIWEWKEKYEARILSQLKQLGASCDWKRTRFTLDEMCTRAVRQTFFDLFKSGYIYRGKRLVNWDTHLQTAVADDEVFHKTMKGSFWTFRYPVVGSEDEFIRFSTTRPETMLGDVAVAVHPEDKRYKKLIGKMVRIPSVDREIPIIADGLLVDPELGTGAVKVTPAHDFNDYQCGLRNKLPMINILAPNGTINEAGGKYAGLERAEARKKITEEMDSLGLLESVEDRDIEMAHSDRSKTPIEPYLSDQWFVHMPALAESAIEAVRSGKVKIHPERYARTYLDWLGEKRDWCISRQLWWGHRIPVWTVRCASPEMLQRFQEFLDWNIKEDPERFGKAISYQIQKDEEPSHAADLTASQPVAEHSDKPHALLHVCSLTDELPPILLDQFGTCGAQRDEDVLDTWFSSALWPHATLGWPEHTKDLAYYYPTSVLVTSRDIITLWVARMVIMGQFNCKHVPFSDVYIHTKILDAFGEGMSKSKGNGVDPLDIIEICGVDALRFGLAHLASETQDARMPVANVCPSCSTLIPVKNEHMYMRTRKVTCPSCQKPFRPGGPWPSDDPELPTAKQSSEQFQLGRNFATKIFNAAKFIVSNLEGYAPTTIQRDSLALEDKWILSRLARTAAAVTHSYERYEFSEIARTLYDFFWGDFCDWYIELAKGRLKDESQRPIVQSVLTHVLDYSCRLLHPIMPFMTEEVWHALADSAGERGLPEPHKSAESIVIADWPKETDSWIDEQAELRMDQMQGVLRAVRNIRAQFNVDSKTEVDALIACDATTAEFLNECKETIRPLAKIRSFEIGPSIARPAKSAASVLAGLNVYVPLAELIDVSAEAGRQQKKLADVEKRLAGVTAKLASDFVSKAPKDVVEQQRQLEKDLTQQKEEITAIIADLSA